jgi:hypothetical protein
MLGSLNETIDRLGRRRDLIASLFLIAVTTLWFADVLFAGRAFYTRDWIGYHYPMKRIVREAVLGGDLVPLWSPYFGGGQPLAANPAYELFYPPQWLVYLPDFYFGMSLHVVVHFYICALGLYFLLRSFGAGSIASTLAAVGFTLGGPMISLIRTLPLLFSLAWAPLLFLFIRRYCLTRSRRDFLLGALCAGMQALVAEPTTMMQTWFIVAAWAVYRVIHTRRDQGRAALLVARDVLLIGMGGIIVSAAQIVPMLDYIPDSVRSQPFPFKDLVSAWSMAPSRPLELFYPQLFQTLFNASGTPWMHSLYPLGEAFVSSYYFGFALAIFFLVGLLAWRRGSGLVLATCAVLYILAIGKNTPLLQFLYDIGIFKSLRYPEKFALGISLVGTIWGALTFDLLLRGDQRVRSWTWRVTLAWFALALLLVLGASSAWGGFWAVTFLRGLLLLAIVFAMVRWPSPVWAASLIVITILDVVHLRAINPTITRDYFEAPPITQQLSPAKQHYRVFHIGEWDWKYSMPHADAFFTDNLGRWWSLRNSLMTRNAAYWGYRYALETDYDQTFLSPTADLVLAMRFLYEARRPGWEEPLMAMSNIWYRAYFRPFAQEVQRTGGDWRQMQPVDFYPALEKYPRYYFADQIEQIVDMQDFVQKMLAGGRSRKVAFIQDGPFTPARGVVRNWEEKRESISLDVEASGRALLLLTVTPHRYWRATIDGADAPLRVANLAYQAIEVPAGKHRIELVYSNPLVVPSAIVSAIAVLLIAVGAVVFKHVPIPVEQEAPPPKGKRR